MPDDVDDDLRRRICAQLDAAVPDLIPPPDLADRVRRRYRARRLRRGSMAGLAAGLLIVGAASASALTSTQPDVRSTMSLAGYSVTLPPGVHASALHFLPESTGIPQPPASTFAAECKITGVGVLFNHPASWGPPPYQEPASTNVALSSPSGHGCISGLVTLPYGSGTAPSPDLVAPSGSVGVDLGPYPAREFDTGGSALAATHFYVAYYVQLPASGGGYQDLIVGSFDIPPAEVIGLVRQVVAQYEGEAPGTG